MNTAYLMKQLLVLLSLGSVGLAAYMAVVNVVDAVRGDRPMFYHAMWKMGYALVAGEVWFAILLRVPAIQLTRDSIIYGIGLLLAAAGCAGIAITHHLAYKRRGGEHAR